MQKKSAARCRTNRMRRSFRVAQGGSFGAVRRQRTPSFGRRPVCGPIALQPESWLGRRARQMPLNSSAATVFRGIPLYTYAPPVKLLAAPPQSCRIVWHASARAHRLDDVLLTDADGHCGCNGQSMRGAQTRVL